MEYLRRATYDESDHERNDSLRHSLVYFKEAAAYISDAKLASIFSVYRQNSFHVGILDLALERAQKIDPQNQGIIAFETPSSRNETTENLMISRLNTYNYIFSALEDLIWISNNGVPQGHIPVPNVTAYVNNIFDTALRSNDKLFHYRLYDWFLAQGLGDRLLTCETPYLIPYFEKYIPDQEKSLRFLHRFYSKKFEYLKASNCLYQLAILPSQTMTLNERVDYLSSASVNARCGNADSEHLDEMARTAAFQWRIQGILESISHENHEASIAVRELDSRLYSYQEMKSLYGGKFHCLNAVFNENQN